MSLLSLLFCDHKAAAGCESLRLEAVTRPQGVWVQLAAGESDWSLSAWSAFFQVHPKSAPGFRYRSTFVSRKLHPSRSVTSHPQRPGLSVAHASVTFCNTRHRLSISFGRVSHQASPSRHTPSSAHPSLFFPVYYRRVPAAE